MISRGRDPKTHFSYQFLWGKSSSEPLSKSALLVSNKTNLQQWSWPKLFCLDADCYLTPKEGGSRKLDYGEGNFVDTLHFPFIAHCSGMLLEEIAKSNLQPMKDSWFGTACLIWLLESPYYQSLHRIFCCIWFFAFFAYLSKLVRTLASQYPSVPRLPQIPITRKIKPKMRENQRCGGGVVSSAVLVLPRKGLDTKVSCASPSWWVHVPIGKPSRTQVTRTWMRLKTPKIDLQDIDLNMSKYTCTFTITHLDMLGLGIRRRDY